MEITQKLKHVKTTKNYFVYSDDSDAIMTIHVPKEAMNEVPHQEIEVVVKW